MTRDPKVGQVFKLRTRSRRIVVALHWYRWSDGKRALTFVDYYRERPNGKLHSTNILRWRKWAANAEVVSVAAEE